MKVVIPPVGLEIRLYLQQRPPKSTNSVLRGLHLQANYAQGKLVRVIRREVFDVGIDLRGDSETYGEWHAEILSEDNKKQLYIPPGFAHRFLVLSDEAEFTHKLVCFINKIF